MLLSEIDKAFDDLQDFMRIYIELYAQDRSIEPNHGRFPRYIGGKINPLYFDEMRWYASKRKPSFNMPQFKDYCSLNKQLSLYSFDYVDINGNLIWTENDYTSKGVQQLNELKSRLKNDYDQNKTTVLKKPYNFWLGFKYYIKLKTYDTI